MNSTHTSSGNAIHRQRRFSIHCGLTAICALVSASAFAQVGVSWTEANSNAIPWGGRNGHTTVVYDNKMWVIGGYGLTANTVGNDVWSSSDGVHWTEVTPAAAWGPREFHTSLVYDNKMWVIGGQQPATNSYYSDVWSSTDGVNWTLATNSPGWIARGYHMSVVFHNKMWVIGGLASSALVPDAWYSSDGVNWTLATSSLPMGFRSRGVALVYNGKIWIMGGNGTTAIYQNDVWNSADGVNWTEVTPDAAWPVRNFHSGVVYNGRMWIMGGEIADNVYSNDVWSSVDGLNWTQATAAADWAPRMSQTSVAFHNKMWVIGGFGNTAGVSGIAGPDVWYTGAASLRGIIVDAATSLPLQCSTVHLTGPALNLVSFADSSGAYRFDDLPTGTYTLECVSPGYATVTQSITIGSPMVYYQDLPLTATAATGSVDGVVTDAASGKPLAGVLVQVLGVAVPGPSTYTCADGHYQLSNLAKDTSVTLQFTADNYDTQTATVNVPSTGSVQQNASMTKSAIFPGVLTGLVTDSQTDAPIAGAQVTVVTGGGISTTTDSSGQYVFAALPAQLYTIQATAPGYTGDPQLADLTNSNAAETNFALTPTAVGLKGDVNGDDHVDAVDIQLVINQALGLVTGYNCDLNKDGVVNAVDVQTVINAALGLAKTDIHRP